MEQSAFLCSLGRAGGEEGGKGLRRTGWLIDFDQVSGTPS